MAAISTCGVNFREGGKSQRPPPSSPPPYASLCPPSSVSAKTPKLFFSSKLSFASSNSCISFRSNQTLFTLVWKSHGTALIVKERLLKPDAQENGWLLDGYPRSMSQATALMEFDFQPDLFILLEVPEGLLVERVVGRRLDPVTGRIYHLKYSPPENEEIAARLTQRFDDTEEKACLELISAV
ncbi:hypothetical protein GH714_020983 [Hevea brasiliensis]|uniref:adenylate kinase n=1 Tax=Hevea brasiliensis TaxID=3981 RepID=A0A6A6LB30_HEVBR|nr:hypothetical protein GH714_020983 [Hevea brasiliensis]